MGCRPGGCDESGGNSADAYLEPGAGPDLAAAEPGEPERRHIDTPGYKARDIDFRQELQRALGEDEGPQAATLVHEVPGLVSRPDGNNVSLDRESLLMAQNQLAFQVDVQLLRAEFNRLQLAINGGSGQ